MLTGPRIFAAIHPMVDEMPGVLETGGTAQQIGCWCLKRSVVEIRDISTSRPAVLWCCGVVVIPFQVASFVIQSILIYRVQRL